MRLRRKWWRSLGRRVCAAVTLCAYLLTALGVPLPAFAIVRPGGAPFPCQDHACGCTSAEHCWQNCCCFTPEQRWVWAQRNSVEPPAYAEKPTGWRTTRLRDRETASTKPCCQEGQRVSTGTCCSRGAPKPTCPTHVKPAPSAKKPGQPSSSKSPWRLAINALRCQGHSTLWVSSGVVAPSGSPLVWQPNLVPVDVIPWSADTPAPLRPSPPDPPPRAAHV